MIFDLYKQRIGRLKFDNKAKPLKLPTPEYNCIAHAIGMMAPNIWPSNSKTSFYENDFGFTAFWPNDLSSDETIDNFLKFFKKFKFEKCEDDSYEQDNQKIALFCIPGSDIVTHAALMRTNELWSSKLGSGPLILHQLHYIEGKDYGEVRCFLKRPWSVYTSGLDKTIIDGYWKKSQLGESIYKEWDEDFFIKD